MMIDRLDALEEKIATLVQKINEAKTRNSELNRQNRELLQIAEQKKIGDQESLRLQERIRQLEEELNQRDDKESTARDRLKVIMSRIDSMESEIAEMETADEQ